MRAAILLQRGAPAERQMHICLQHAIEVGYLAPLLIRIGATDDLMHLVRDGLVDVVVAAFDSKLVTWLAGELRRRVRVEVVRPTPHVVTPPHRAMRTAAELIRRLRERGQTTKEIAVLLDESTGDIRRALDE